MVKSPISSIARGGQLVDQLLNDLRISGHGVYKIAVYLPEKLLMLMIFFCILDCSEYTVRFKILWIAVEYDIAAAYYNSTATVKNAVWSASVIVNNIRFQILYCFHVCISLICLYVMFISCVLNSYGPRTNKCARARTAMQWTVLTLMLDSVLRALIGLYSRHSTFAKLVIKRRATVCRAQQQRERYFG